MAETAIEVLFDLDASAAAELAEKRLLESLAHDCVPSPLVKLLFEKGRDPFRPLVERLEALSCARRRLRPESALFTSEKDVEALKERAKVVAADVSSSCGKALEELFGIGEPAAR